MRMNCNLFRAIRLGYVRMMIDYCRRFGWRYFWKDTCITWWRVKEVKCPHCKQPTHVDRLGRVKYDCMMRCAARNP
jgi:hypothetical protein